MIDAADARIGRDQLIRELGDRFHEGRIYHEGPKDTKILCLSGVFVVQASISLAENVAEKFRLLWEVSAMSGTSL